MKKLWALVLIGFTALTAVAAENLTDCQECKKNKGLKLTVIVVKKGDSWDSISKKYSIPRDYLIKINRCMSDKLAVNDIILIPEHHVPEEERFGERDKRFLEFVRGDIHFQKGQKLFSEKKYADAVIFFNDAACFDDNNAMYLLGQCYEKGLGVKKDISKAIQFYRFIGDLGEVWWFKNRFPHKASEALNKIKIANAPELKDVKFVFTPQTDNTKAKMKFIKDDKVLFSVTSKVDRLCFMQEVVGDKNGNVMRIAFSDNHFDKDFDFRTMLLDLHGNDDFRYLMIADHHIGTSSTGHKIYVVDAKDNFKFIAEIDGGEIMQRPYTQKDLTFTKNILHLGYFGNDGEAIVAITVRHASGKTPEIVYEKVELTAKNMESIIKFFQEKQQQSTRKDEEMAISLMYALMIESGNFNSAKELAAKLGYSSEYIDQFHKKIINRIKESENRAIIEKLNNIDLSEI